METSTGRKGIVFFVLSILMLIYWVLVDTIKIYNHAVTGAIYEILWLPMIGLLFFLPLTVLVLWAVNKWSLKSFYFYTLLVCIFTFGMIYLLTYLR